VRQNKKYFPKHKNRTRTHFTPVMTITQDRCLIDWYRLWHFNTVWTFYYCMDILPHSILLPHDTSTI